MPPQAVKAILTVQAGVFPGESMQELFRHWSYTSEDYAKDCALGPEASADASIFTQRLKDAHAYALSLTDPSRVNWVRTEWIWV